MGSALAITYAQQHLGASNPVETVGQLVDIVQGMGAAGMGVFATVMIFLQVVPIANAFVLTLSAGALFGAPAGTALTLVCSTIAATISFLVARHFGRDLVMESAQQSKEFMAIDKEFGEASFSKSLTLITLLRASPVLPFTWGNYLFGLSALHPLTFSLGTFLGCLPSCAAYVYAGQAGADIVVNGPAGTDPHLLILGVLATVGGISVASNIAKDALKKAGLDLSE